MPESLPSVEVGGQRNEAQTRHFVGRPEMACSGTKKWRMRLVQNDLRSTFRPYPAFEVRPSVSGDGGKIVRKHGGGGGARKMLTYPEHIDKSILVRQLSRRPCFGTLLDAGKTFV